MRVFCILLSEILLGVASAVAYACWPRLLALPKPEPLQVITTANGTPAVSSRGRYLVGKIAEFDDPLFAYLMFDYFRSCRLLKGKQVVLTIDRTSHDLVYRISVHLPDDELSGVTELARLKTDHFASGVEYSWITPDEFSRDLRDTDLFVDAYNYPNFPTLQQISTDDLQFYIRRFIRFKSATDPRTWGDTPFHLSPVDVEEADRLASDIIAVANFYEVPVDVFLGIGAMENNFLNAPGDLNNAVWQRRAQRDDIVLQRKRHQVWVLNSSMGIWQITRNSLRKAHELFLADQRPYSELPERLRPAKDLEIDSLNPDVLTTYAGLLLRDLIDYFDGDVILAVGAYNGTRQMPNLRYAAGAELIASYAERIIGNAARLNGRYQDNSSSLEAVRLR